MLSINIGGEPDIRAIPGAIPLHSGQADQQFSRPPFGADGHGPSRTARSDRWWRRRLRAGAALSKRWLDATGKRPQITIFARAARLVPELPAKAALLLYECLTRAGCTVRCGHSVSRMESKRLHLDNGEAHEFDACFLVTAVAPPAWLKRTGLALDDAGFIAVEPTLQSPSHPNIFAAGDVATIVGSPRPKAGVYAVRAGPVLADNIRRFVAGRRTRPWKPQKRALAILGTADGSSVGIRASHASHSPAWWWLKKWIDRRWMAKYTDLEMAPPPAPAALAGLGKGLDTSDPAFEAMRCLGCGAKTGHETLAAAMGEAAEIAVELGADPRLMPPDGLNEDSAILPVPESGEMVQSVDVISEIVSDPFQLGRIAAVHAMSDIYAANAVPVWAMAAVTLATARADLQQTQLAHLMAGGLVALSEAGAQLVGGHTGESDALGIGYSVTGWREGPPGVVSAEDEPVLILTKPLGTGVIMAGHMQLAARGEWMTGAAEMMARGNGFAAATLAPHRPVMTDVTGFGLARHAMNLAERCGMPGVEIDIAALPLLDGAMAMLEAGHRSTLHPQNRAAVRIDGAETLAPIADILFDPQTSGGLLAAIPRADASELVKDFHQSGQPASIIGRLNDIPGITLKDQG